MDEFGVIGLGRIGGGLAHLALEKGLRAVGARRSGAPQALVKAGRGEMEAVRAVRGGPAPVALEKGLRVVGASRSGAPQDLVKAGLAEIKDFGAFREKLRAPRAVLLYVPAGPAVDKILEQLAQALEPGDSVVDGG